MALIAFITAVWLSLYMGWAIHSLRLIPRFTNTLLACCGREYEVCTRLVGGVVGGWVGDGRGHRNWLEGVVVQGL